MAPVLRLPDFSQEFVIKCDDVSGKRLVDILTQNGRPVAYYSKTSGERNLAKTIYCQNNFCCRRLPQWISRTGQQSYFGINQGEKTEEQILYHTFMKIRSIVL